MSLYLISDNHSGSEAVIRYFNRPFPNVAEMDIGDTHLIGGDYNGNEKKV